jgi:hypothetical protein
LLVTVGCGTSAKTSTRTGTSTPTAAPALNALYVISSNLTPSGPTSATVSALGLSNGTQLWQHTLSAQSVSAVSGGRTLYLATVMVQSRALLSQAPRQFRECLRQ